MRKRSKPEQLTHSDSIPDSEKTSLGPEQEDWLRAEIMNSEAHFTIIAAGVQILPDDRGQERIYDISKQALLESYNPNTSKAQMVYPDILLISGDVHYGEMLSDQCTEHTHGYKLWEFTSSGISHADGEYPYIGAVPYLLGMMSTPESFNVC
jgi:phosphodiesterase/alkaline phosphatase D-like protein